MTNDQHQEYVDHSETTGPGARIRARIAADAMERLADQWAADHAEMLAISDHGRGYRIAAGAAVDGLRGEAARLLAAAGIHRCHTKSPDGHGCLLVVGHDGPHEARSTVIRWTSEETNDH